MEIHAAYIGIQRGWHTERMLFSEPSGNEGPSLLEAQGRGPCRAVSLFDRRDGVGMAGVNVIRDCNLRQSSEAAVAPAATFPARSWGSLREVFR